jgi:hypothetical protein
MRRTGNRRASGSLVTILTRIWFWVGADSRSGRRGTGCADRVALTGGVGGTCPVAIHDGPAAAAARPPDGTGLRWRLACAGMWPLAACDACCNVVPMGRAWVLRRITWAVGDSVLARAVCAGPRHLRLATHSYQHSLSATHLPTCMVRAWSGDDIRHNALVTIKIWQQRGQLVLDRALAVGLRSK